MLDRTERDQRRGALRALREGGTYAPERPDEAAAENGGDPTGSSGDAGVAAKPSSPAD
jgi:hypothetical protein